MADSKLSGLAGTLTSATIAAGDLFGVEDISDSNTLKNITRDELRLVARAGMTASRAVEIDASGNMVASDVTAAELAKLDGLLATVAQLNYLASVTAGTAAANKCAVLGATKNIDEMDIETLSIDGTEITATGAEINTTDGATGEVRGLNQGLTRVTPATLTTTQTLDADDAGFAAVSTSAGNVDITLPPLALSNGGLIYEFVLTTAGNDLTINDDADDAGFSKSDGSTTGTRITIDAAGDSVIIRSSGYAGGRWLIVGGYGYTLA